MSLLSKLIYGFSTILIKMPADFFPEIDRLILKFTWQLRGLRTAHTILIKAKMGGLTHPGFKTLFKATAITVWCWHKDTHINQWIRVDSSEINLSIYGLLIFNKGAKTIQCGKNSKWCWNKLYIHMQNNEDGLLTSHHM